VVNAPYTQVGTYPLSQNVEQVAEFRALIFNLLMSAALLEGNLSEDFSNYTP